MDGGDRFNAFHLEVACVSERLRWVLDRFGMPDDDGLAQVGLDVFASMLDDLEASLERHSHPM